ncbi:efflux RND transporter periplasmic adaptor subunit [Alteromonas sp. M12]|uniref:efflux RND transporter periplasmic adaptor subunit n=1 Tax=Alteromonas sp. M12 TaxID=3135644 RepID=UPI00319D902B
MIIKNNKALLLSLLLTFSGHTLAQQDSDTLVEVDEVYSEMISQQIWVPGTVVSRSDSNIATEVPGRITWMAEVGDLVEVGEVLAKVDDHMLKLNLEQNQANVAKWESRVDLLSRKQQRFSSMAQQANTSKDQLDEIVSELEVARQELNQAKVDQKLTQYRITQSQIKAPFKAMVVERIQSPGEYISTGQTVLRVVDTGNIEASIKAPLSAVPFIQQGLAVKVVVGEFEKSHQIRAIVPVGNARSRMMEIRVQLTPDEYAIGGAVRVALPHSEFHQALTVPRDALVLRKSGAFVYQIAGDNEVKQVAVTVGIGVGERVEVFGDLNHISPVVVRGAERLKDGQKVRFSEQLEELATL